MRAYARLCTGGQPLCSGHTLLPRASAPRSQPVMARGGGGGGAQPTKPSRNDVTFVVPGQRSYKFDELTQRTLNDALQKLGALGFELDDGRLSQNLEKLAEGATVKLVLVEDPPFAKQVRNLQASFDNSTRSKELEVEAFLVTLASTESAGAHVTALQTAPFKTMAGQDYVQFDAAVRAGQTVYVAEVKRALGEDSIGNLAIKLPKIRAALRDGASPDLAATLQGVTETKLFLGGEMVRAGLTVQQMVDDAALVGMSVVLPSGQGMGIVAGAAPAVQL